jgi:hypothetical protein
MAAINRIGNTNTIVSPSSATVVISTAPQRSVHPDRGHREEFHEQQGSSYGTNHDGLALDATWPR